MSGSGDTLAPLRNFVVAMTTLVESTPDEPMLFERGEQLLSALIEHDTWLPPSCAEAKPERYQQYLLYCDPYERFSVVSFVWGPAQQTPIHDHTAWGMIGMLRGAEISCPYVRDANHNLIAGEARRLEPGQIEKVSPRIGDIHAVANAFADRVSISIHIYGANIGTVKRHAFNPQTGVATEFVSGYSSNKLPNFCSGSVRLDAGRDW